MWLAAAMPLAQPQVHTGDCSSTMAWPAPRGLGYMVKRTKRIRWMPWQLKAMKDVEVCDKPRGAGKQALIRGFPNGETQPVQLAIAHRIHRCARQTRGTEISKYPEEQKSTEIPEVAMSEPGSALKRFGMRRIRPSPLAEAPGKVRHSG